MFRRTKPVLDAIYKVRQADLNPGNKDPLAISICACGDSDVYSVPFQLDAIEIIVASESTFVQYAWTSDAVCQHINSDGSRGESLPDEELHELRRYFLSGGHRHDVSAD